VVRNGSAKTKPGVIFLWSKAGDIGGPYTAKTAYSRVAPAGDAQKYGGVMYTSVRTWFFQNHTERKALQSWPLVLSDPPKGYRSALVNSVKPFRRRVPDRLHLLQWAEQCWRPMARSSFAESVGAPYRFSSKTSQLKIDPDGPRCDPAAQSPGGLGRAEPITSQHEACLHLKARTGRLLTPD